MVRRDLISRSASTERRYHGNFISVLKEEAFLIVLDEVEVQRQESLVLDLRKGGKARAKVLQDLDRIQLGPRELNLLLCSPSKLAGLGEVQDLHLVGFETRMRREIFWEKIVEKNEGKKEERRLKVKLKGILTSTGAIVKCSWSVM